MLSSCKPAGTRQDVPGAMGTPHMQGVRELSHPDQRPSKGANCYRYGKSGHSAARCRFKDAKCHYCGKIGHIRAATPERKDRAGSKPNLCVWFRERWGKEYLLFHIKSTGRSNPLMITIRGENCPVLTEVDIWQSKIGWAESSDSSKLLCEWVACKI